MINGLRRLVESDNDPEQPRYCGGTFGGNSPDARNEVANWQRLTSSVRLPPPPPLPLSASASATNSCSLTSPLAEIERFGTRPLSTQV